MLKEHNLSSISAQKYNPWCQRRPLVCSDQERVRRATAFFARGDLAPSERAAFYLHELTGCEGLEFVAFSSVKLQNPVMLANDVVLVPCFLNNMEGQNVQDRLVQMTMKMEQNCRFIYDGWMPIAVWGEENVRQAVRSVDEAISIFCLRSRAFFEWEPKYPAPGDSSSNYKFEDQHLRELEEIAQILDSLGQRDRVAIYRSLAWLSQGLRLNGPAARFLFSILAIESLATYIEEKASNESPLAVLRTTQITEAEREKCIRDTLSEWLQDDPRKAIERAYFDCVISITRRLKAHLERIFTSDPESYALLFEHEVEGKTLYDLRHYVAHGTADALSEMQRERIRQRVWDAGRVARRYVLAVFETALGAKPFSKGMQASFILGIQDAVVSNEDMYQGPTHMAVVYSP
jgi:hypothetical protein